MSKNKIKNVEKNAEEDDEKNVENNVEKEYKLNHINYLISCGFSKKKLSSLKTTCFYLEKEEKEDKESILVYTRKTMFNKYLKQFHTIDVCLTPEECYIKYGDGNIVVKVLEIRYQEKEGAFEDKLKCSIFNIQEYKSVLPSNFKFEYGICVSEFIFKKLNSDNPKYSTIKKILTQNGVKFFVKEDKDKDESNLSKQILDWVK